MLKNWKVLAVIAVIIILILWWFYAQGKKAATGPQISYPKGGTEIPAGWEPTPLAKELHDVMSGIFTMASTKDHAWQKLLDLPTDEMVIAVYNAYNQLYFTEGSGTLTDWIRAETNYAPKILGGVKADLLDRLEKLNLQ